MIYLPLVAYFAGLVCLICLGLQELTRRRRTQPVGQHRARGRQTRTAARAMAAATRTSKRAFAHYQALKALKLPDFAPIPGFVLPPPGPLAPSTYDHAIGAGRYAHLRQAELDETNDRLLKLRERRQERRLGPAPEVDLQALRVRGAVPTVGEVDDEWAYELLAPAVAR